MTQGQARILIVEDDHAVAAATRLFLRSCGFQVMTAGSLADALKAAQGSSIDLVVADYHLSDGETGLQVIDALRAMLSQRLKALLLTGDTSPEAAALLRDPFMRVARKPIHAEELLSQISTLLAAD
jgi:CheY-like chemotaxis protein